MAAAAAPEASYPAAGACAPVPAGLVDSLFQHWAELVRAGDPEGVADLYAADALLLPTLSARTRQSHAAIADYFSGFAARHPQAEVVEHTVYTACNQLVDAGLYRFRFPAAGPGAAGLAEGQPPLDTLVEARYTLVYGFNGQQWQLLHHHSSLLPDSAPILPVDP
ncbi:MAG: DUF4440 domain-containing protein [Cyanobium sp. M30B3]|jgi:hypothetical protein|nr:MAG: DUF4440 domain-containing protein [Cyanobium sp. M30B3]